MKRQLEIIPSRPNIDDLPLELQHKIVKNIFNLMINEDEKSQKYFDQTKLQEHVLEMPILLGIKYAQEFHQLQKMCHHKIEGKDFLAHELFCSSYEQREEVFQMVKRSQKESFYANIIAVLWNAVLWVVIIRKELRCLG